jgi:hypothetical protein
MLKLRIPQATKRGVIEVGVGGVFDFAYPDSSTRRGRVQEEGTVCPTIMCTSVLLLFEGYEDD